MVYNSPLETKDFHNKNSSPLINISNKATFPQDFLALECYPCYTGVLPVAKL